MSDKPETTSPDENPDELSALGREFMDTDFGKSSSGGTGARRWVPPAPEELADILPSYEISKMLGRGGMGAVYMGRQISLDRPVAIKILSTELEAADEGFADRFKNEARSMAKLEHPGIVAVYDFGETEDGMLFIVMQYVDGTDVARMIASDGRLHTEHAMAITAHVCDALAYAHDCGIMHRDIKPANIMVGYDGVVKVADFGLAKAHDTDSDLGLTMSGMVMGTVHYMAPETVLVGSGNVDHRADIYAVGVMLYHMLTGRVPHGIFELPSLQVKGLDPRYDDIIARAMREDRDRRYQSAGDLRGDLDAILTQPVAHLSTLEGKNEPTKVPAALPTDARPRRPSGGSGGRRHPLITGAAVGSQSPASPPQPKTNAKWTWPIVVLGILVLAGIGWWMRSQPQSEDLAKKFFRLFPNETATSPIKDTLSKASAVPQKEHPFTTPISDEAFFGTWVRTNIDHVGPDYLIEIFPDGKAEWIGDGTSLGGSWALDSSGTMEIQWDSDFKFQISARSANGDETLQGIAKWPNGKTAEIVYSRTTSSENQSSRDSGSISLFDGKSLKGWKLVGKPNAFSVENGILESAGTRTTSGNLFYVGNGPNPPKFTDFDLRMKVRTSSGGNSGVWIHCDSQQTRTNAGLEVQIYNASRDHRTGTIYYIKPFREARVKDLVWFDFRIVVRGNTITTFINEQEAVSWTQPDDWVPPLNSPMARLDSGTIGLQSHANGPVSFKEIVLTPLD